MYHCVNCGAEVEELYRRYCPNVLKLLKCDACGHLADKYIEYDPVIILVDLILLEKRAYRHLLYNCDLKSCWKLLIILWLVESFRSLSLCNNNKKSIETSRMYPSSLERHCNLYLILLQTAFCFASFIFVVILLTKIKWYFYSKSSDKCSMIHLTKALVIGGSGKLLGLLEITWGHIFLAPHYFLILGYTLLCMLTAYSVITNSGKMESLIILELGIVIYNYSFNFFTATLESLQLV
ncbi:ACAT-related protein required for viability 1 [Osmia lignaria lignaria]|uniref:ACAT-related protein required for viability 1 n=1 Tax=Osmia lignaria lignaria TaxID=1437193 RepID=UPI001478BD84|nr:protein ARV1 [Osmia lignaria]XP_034194107.1 protein ARV1 [Osmia lignaria]XP_034194108.1 protein ARV1 [Osmia lignaria]